MLKSTIEWNHISCWMNCYLFMLVEFDCLHYFLRIKSFYWMVDVFTGCQRNMIRKFDRFVWAVIAALNAIDALAIPHRSWMAGKGKKKKDATGGNKEKKKGGKKKTGRTAGSGKSSRIQGDIFSDGAMENAYLLCHNVQVCHQQQVCTTSMIVC